MVHLCKIMVGAFEGRNGRYDETGEEGYSDRNLECGIIYAEDLQEAGYLSCPMDGFDLAQFEAWCHEQLSQ